MRILTGRVYYHKSLAAILGILACVCYLALSKKVPDAIEQILSAFFFLCCTNVIHSITLVDAYRIRDKVAIRRFKIMRKVRVIGLVAFVLFVVFRLIL
jgi:Ca2+/Na+ antiporter